ncbi:MAG: class I tRNA ligase family protein, partial [Candidatus Woesearchaeota archaeon]|nr:class I tRNA ligase family protein [Candidatus Woesearchaeota archaeon]
KDGHKMSKSFGNVVFQTDISEKYGIDTARLFLMFVASPDKQMEWSDSGVEGSYRIIGRMIALKDKLKKGHDEIDESKINLTIKRVTEGIETFQYPKAIIALIDSIEYFSRGISKEHYSALLKMFSVFCPHISEELWHEIGNKSFISIESWPQCDEKKISEESEELFKILSSVKEDIRRIIELAKAKDSKASAKSVKLVLADKWKYNALEKIRKSLEKTRNMGEIMKALLSEKELSPKAKEVSILSARILKNPQLMVQGKITQEKERLFLEREKAGIENELGFPVIIETAEKSSEQKKEQSIPGKPAIIVNMQ